MWIRVDCSLAEHKKTTRLKRRLGPAPVEVAANDARLVIGTLVLLWLKTRVQAHDGVYDDCTTEDMADLIGCGPEFVELLVEVGYLEKSLSGFAVPDWEEHNGQHLKEAAKKAAQRAAKRAGGPASNSSVSSVRPSGRLPSDDPGTAGGRPGDSPGTVSAGPGATELASLLTREGLYTAAAVPAEQWDVIEEFCGLSPADASPEAQATRAAVAAMGEQERLGHLEPILERNRERARKLVLDLAGAGPTKEGPRRLANAKLADAPAAPLPVDKEIKVNRAAIAELSKKLGPDGQHEAIALANRLVKAGMRSPKLVERFVRHYVDHAPAIKNIHAYYNPGAEGFEWIRNRLAADTAVEEQADLAAAERRWLAGGTNGKGH